MVVWTCSRTTVSIGEHLRYMKSSMANVYLFAVGTASVLGISLMTTVAEDEAHLLKRAQELFEPLPKDMATARVSHYQRACRSGATVVF